MSYYKIIIIDKQKICTNTYKLETKRKDDRMTVIVLFYLLYITVIIISISSSAYFSCPTTV